MDENTQEYNLFSTYEDIFSQYDDNFALEDNVRKYERDLKSNENICRNELTLKTNSLAQAPNVSNKKIVPKFGKKRNSNKESQKVAKKFIPPSECTKVPEILENTETNINSFGPIFDTYNQCLPPTNEHYINQVTDHSQNKQKHSKKEKHTKMESVFGGLILGSLNVLNDEDVILTQETQSDQSSVKGLLSRHESISSVASLKTYKNLDTKSFEIPNNNHKIYTGDDYLKLFENNNSNKYVKPVAMSTIFGDIGFNVKYSDYVKNGGFNNNEIVGEERDAFMKILAMYPEDNKCLISMKVNY